MRLVFLLVLVVGILIAGFAGYTAMKQFSNYDSEISYSVAAVNETKNIYEVYRLFQADTIKS